MQRNVELLCDIQEKGLDSLGLVVLDVDAAALGGVAPCVGQGLVRPRGSVMPDRVVEDLAVYIGPFTSLVISAVLGYCARLSVVVGRRKAASREIQSSRQGTDRVKGKSRMRKNEVYPG